MNLTEFYDYLAARPYARIVRGEWGHLGPYSLSGDIVKSKDYVLFPLSTTTWTGALPAIHRMLPWWLQEFSKAPVAMRLGSTGPLVPVSGVSYHPHTETVTMR